MAGDMLVEDLNRLSRALDQVMTTTRDYALGALPGMSADKQKRRAARKLLSRYQGILDQHGLTWVSGIGIVTNGKHSKP